MFSKAESTQLKKEFWTAFGKSFPRKWLLYDTKIKDFSFKFFADKKSAGVFLDIEMADKTTRDLYFDKIDSLSTILQNTIKEYQTLKNYTLENGKIIHRFAVTKHGVSIFNKDNWQEIFEFFVENMSALEDFYIEYQDYIKDIN